MATLELWSDRAANKKQQKGGESVWEGGVSQWARYTYIDAVSLRRVEAVGMGNRLLLTELCFTAAGGAEMFPGSRTEISNLCLAKHDE